MHLLQKAQSEFFLSAISETYSKLDCANLLETPKSSFTLSFELKMKEGALSRFLNAAAFLGMCKKNEDETYQHITNKKFDKELSLTLFYLVTSRILESMPLDIITLKSSEQDWIKKACNYGFLFKIGNKVSVPSSLVKYFDKKSSQYIGPIVMHYRKIMYPMYSSKGILSALRSGTSQWQQFFGRGIKSQFEAYQTEPELLQIFTTALHKMNFEDNINLLSHIEIKTGAKTLDLGGGSGALACCITDRFEACQVDIYELEEAIPMLMRVLEAMDSHTCKNYIPGNFQLDTTSGELLNLEKRRYDAIFLSWILHDWTDETCIKILKKVKRHLHHSGTVYILEGLLPDNKVGQVCLLDIAMLLQTEGKERTFGEYKYLLEQAGLGNVKKIITSGRRQIIRAKPL